MRLTRKIEPSIINGYPLPKYDYNRDYYGALLSSTEAIINKLGKLEDIEEKYSCDLFELLNLLKNKGVDLYNLRRTYDVEDYNRFRHYYYDELTEEEYKLFKEFYAK